MDRYKTSALIGTLIMGISSFIACLATEPVWKLVGNLGLILSIIIMSYGFNKWQP